MADNGWYTERVTASDLIEAHKIINQIKKAITFRANDTYDNSDIAGLESTKETEDGLIPYSGHFTDPPRLFKIEEEEIKLES